MSHANRKDARRAGQRLYFPAAPCSHGHTEGRYVSTGHCLGCIRERRALEQQTAKAAFTGQSRVFAYGLHPDDVAAALAFCQALDLQRGRMPKPEPLDLSTPKAAAFAEGLPLVLPENIARARRQYDPSPEVLAQHEAARK